MHEYSRIAFNLPLLALLSGCILGKDLNQLWAVAGSDESLQGTWEVAETKSIVRLHFDVGPTNMLCTVTAGDSQNPITLPPARCRTIKDVESNICFLLFPDSYSAVSSYFGGVNNEEPDGMGMLVPYCVTDDKKLVVYSHQERVLLDRIKAKEVPGGMLHEGGNPSSREKLRPFVENPSLATLRLISTDVVNTNALLMAFGRKQVAD